MDTITMLCTAPDMIQNGNNRRTEAVSLLADMIEDTRIVPFESEGTCKYLNPVVSAHGSTVVFNGMSLLF